MNDRSQFGTDRSQTEILINATMQALLINLLAEIERGASIEEMRDVMQGLLRQAQGPRILQ
jgi:hypothetical protein